MAPNLSFGVTGCVMAASLYAPFELPRPCERPRPEICPPTRSAMDAMDVDCCEPEGSWQRVKGGGADGCHPGARRHIAAGAHPSDCYQPSTPALGRQLQTQSAGGGSGSSAASPDNGWLRGASSTASASPQRSGMRGASGGSSGDDRCNAQSGGGPGCTVASGLQQQELPGRVLDGADPAGQQDGQVTAPPASVVTLDPALLRASVCLTLPLGKRAVWWSIVLDMKGLELIHYIYWAALLHYRSSSVDVLPRYSSMPDPLLEPLSGHHLYRKIRSLHECVTCHTHGTLPACHRWAPSM